MWWSVRGNFGPSRQLVASASSTRTRSTSCRFWKPPSTQIAPSTASTAFSCTTDGRLGPGSQRHGATGPTSGATSASGAASSSATSATASASTSTSGTGATSSVTSAATSASEGAAAVSATSRSAPSASEHADTSITHRIERHIAVDSSRKSEDSESRPARRSFMQVAITGASGLLGKALVASLRARGKHVSRFVRRVNARVDEPGEIPWSPMDGVLDPARLEGLSAIVHLAGESVAGGRWTEARKASIRESRVLGTRTLVDALARTGNRPKVLVSASAIGYYGTSSGDATLDESSPAGDDFLAEVCRAWEAEAQRAETLGMRVVRTRIGVVLDPNGGALEKMLGPYKAGLGGKVGSGRQWMSWITLADVVRACEHVLDHETLSGAVNLVAGDVTQAEFSRTLAQVLGRPGVIRLPGFAVKALFGEMGDTLLLGGQRVTAKALRESGFTFNHPVLEPALRQLLSRDSG